METNQQSRSQEQDQQPSSQQSSSELTLVPFIPEGDGWNANDYFLASLYQRTEEQSLVKIVYWEGSVRSPRDFIEMAKRRSTVMVFPFDGNRCVGYAWLAPISGNYALPHFCFFKEVWGDRSREIAREIIDYWFSFPGEGGRLLDVLIGVIPDLNVHARKFVEEVGATHLGVVPNMFKSVDKDGRRDAYFYYWTPEDV